VLIFCRFGGSKSPHSELDKMQNHAVDEEDDVQLNEEFISWMMLDIESNRGNGNGNGNSNISADGDENEDAVSSPETVEKAEGNDDNRITGQKRKVSRSRELAKESRMRQRLKQQETEKRIAELRAENSELQAHLQNVTQRTTEVQRQRLDMERIMADKLRELATMNESNNRELEEILRKFVELYADYGGYRQKEVCLFVLFSQLLLTALSGGLPSWSNGEIIPSNTDDENASLDPCSRSKVLRN
jgi:vacuolar-type H+-ATPase subunit I/STV1